MTTERPRRAYGLLGVVGAVLVVILAEVFVIAAENAARPALSAAALSSLVPSSANGKPALTWTNATAQPEGRPSELSTAHLLLVAACSGGGGISITISDRTSVTLNCSTPTTAGPLAIDRQHTNLSAVSVQATDGNPRYIARLIAADA